MGMLILNLHVIIAHVIFSVVVFQTNEFVVEYRSFLNATGGGYAKLIGASAGGAISSSRGSGGSHGGRGNLFLQ